MKKTCHPLARLYPRPALLLCAFLLGCIDTPSFEVSQKVDRPKVLAVIAEPPEVRPGDGVTLSIMLGGFGKTPPTRIEWFACGAFTSTMGGRQYGDEANRKGCGGDDLTVSLGEGAVGLIPGEFTRLIFDNAELAADTFGVFLPPGSVELVREQVGLAVLIEARVSYGDGKVFRAVKRVVVKNGEGHTNPPPPAFAIAPIDADDTDAGAADASTALPVDAGTTMTDAGTALPVDIVGQAGTFHCETVDSAPLDSAPLVLPSSTRLELIPATPKGEDEPWLEDYSVLNARGELERRTERAFYSWYSDGGRLADDVTKSPLRNNLFTTPRKCGNYNLWLFVQDGHGGGSACALEFRIDPPEDALKDGGMLDCHPLNGIVADGGIADAAVPDAAP